MLKLLVQELLGNIDLEYRERYRKRRTTRIMQINSKSYQMVKFGGSSNKQVGSAKTDLLLLRINTAY
jgi:hypothetical protein